MPYLLSGIPDSTELARDADNRRVELRALL